MKNLFRRLQPPQKFRINVGDIAQLLKIPKHLIVRVECWAYIIFVHRIDKGGQFISYRQLQQWQNAVASQIQNCLMQAEMQLLWNLIEDDYSKYNQQFSDLYLPFLSRIWSRYWDKFQGYAVV